MDALFSDISYIWLTFFKNFTIDFWGFSFSIGNIFIGTMVFSLICIVISFIKGGKE